MVRYAEKRALGTTGIQVARLGVAGGYGCDAATVQVALDAGLNFFHCDPDWSELNEGLRAIIPRRRSELVLSSGTMHRDATSTRRKLEAALRATGCEAFDVFFLYYVENRVEVEQLWGTGGAARELEAARREGLVKAVGISSHTRPLAGELLAEQRGIDVVMIRYNLAHRGAEHEVFPVAVEQRIGVVSFTATRWGSLLKPVPALTITPATPAECYTFALSHPAVDVTMTAPRSSAQLQNTLDTWPGTLNRERYTELLAFGEQVRQRSSFN